MINQLGRSYLPSFIHRFLEEVFLMEEITAKWILVYIPAGR